MKFGQYLRTLRAERGLSLRKLSALVQIDPGYLSRVEQDQAPPPSTEILLRLAAELEADSDVFLAAAGEVSKELRAIICEHPKAFAALLRELKDASEKEIVRVARQVRDGEW